MLVESEDLQNVIDKARELADYHKQNYIGHDDPIKSVDQLVHICTNYLNKTIVIKEHPISSESSIIKGFFVAYDDRYEIILLSNLNYCWSRLIRAKELFHVIIDEEKYRNPSISKLINQVTTMFPHNESKPDAYTTSEILTEIGAMEFLFPYETRKALLKFHDEKNEKPNYQEIALRHKIPQLLVEKYLSDDYMAVLDC